MSQRDRAEGAPRAEESAATPDGRPAAVQPRWRKDFPIDWDEAEYIARRDLVKFLLLTSFAFAGGHAWLLARDLLRTGRKVLAPVAVAVVDDLAIGQGQVFHYPAGGPPRILVRLGRERFVAYDQACTHLSCPVLPQPRDGILHCPCHEGAFDLESGRPVAGPPRRPLPRVTLAVKDGVVYATGVEERAG